MLFLLIVLIGMIVFWLSAMYASKSNEIKQLNFLASIFPKEQTKEQTEEQAQTEQTKTEKSKVLIDLDIDG